MLNVDFTEKEKKLLNGILSNAVKNANSANPIPYLIEPNEYPILCKIWGKISD